MIPFILYGSYWTGAQVLRRDNAAVAVGHHARNGPPPTSFQYVVGSFVMAAVCAVAAATAVSYALLVLL